MHVLKPEAIKRYPEKKYTECTYKHKNHLYIFIYIYGPFQENGETIMHKQSSRSEMSRRTENRRSQGDEGKHEIKTKAKKRAKSNGVQGK